MDSYPYLDNEIISSPVKKWKVSTIIYQVSWERIYLDPYHQLGVTGWIKDLLYNYIVEMIKEVMK